MIRNDTHLMTMMIINIMINHYDTDDLTNHDDLIKDDDDEDGAVKEM